MKFYSYCISLTISHAKDPKKLARQKPKEDDPTHRYVSIGMQVHLDLVDNINPNYKKTFNGPMDPNINVIISEGHLDDSSGNMKCRSPRPD